MTRQLTLAITADLHWGHRKGHDATLALVQQIRDQPPDVFILAGDIGTGPHFDSCLQLFADLDCVKALVPGNHDLWVPHEQTSPDSLDLYERLLPQTAQRHGFHYLDHGPLFLAHGSLALVGTINWYDYSWALDGIRRHYPAEEHRLESKRFTRGRHNDANFVRWPLTDEGFTSLLTATFERHLRAALDRADKIIVVAHHPPFYDLSFPHAGPPVELDSFLWDAFAGNVGIEQLLAQHASRIAFAFCGHTHRQRESVWQGIRGYNIGGDYHFKRLLRFTWPKGQMQARNFGDRESN